MFWESVSHADAKFPPKTLIVPGLSLVGGEWHPKGGISVAKPW